MNILEELWYGRISPMRNEDHCTQEYRELENLFQRNEGDLLRTLNENQKRSLQNMKEQWEEMESIVERAAFINGFRLAVQLIAASV